MSLLLRSEVEDVFSEVAKCYGLIFRGGNDGEVLLVAKSYVIGVSIDRDGVSFMYYDIAENKGYNLGLFLINKRRALLSFSSADRSDKPLPNYLRHNLDIFSRHLVDAGADILSGEKDWIRQYSWSPVNVNRKF